jgi:hypothetical protein
MQHFPLAQALSLKVSNASDKVRSAGRCAALGAARRRAGRLAAAGAPSTAAPRPGVPAPSPARPLAPQGMDADGRLPDLVRARVGAALAASQPAVALLKECLLRGASGGAAAAAAGPSASSGAESAALMVRRPAHPAPCMQLLAARCALHLPWLC